MGKASLEKWNPEILDNLELADLQRGFTCYPWDTTPTEYLGYARQELKSGDGRSRINAMGHAKRAIHSHVDFLLHNCGRCLREANFPAKLDLLGRLGIIAPSILNKYNRLRNIIEHEYRTPSRDEATEVVDVAALFLEATRCYVRPLPNALAFVALDGTGACTVDCRWDEGTITIVASGENLPVFGACEIDGERDRDLWLKWVARILQAIQDIDNPYVRCDERAQHSRGIA